MDQVPLQKHNTKILKIAIWQSLSKFLCDDLEIIVVKLSQMLPYMELGIYVIFYIRKRDLHRSFHIIFIISYFIFALIMYKG